MGKKAHEKLQKITMAMPPSVIVRGRILGAMSGQSLTGVLVAAFEEHIANLPPEKKRVVDAAWKQADTPD